MRQPYAYGSWGLVATMVLVSLFFILQYLPMRSRMARRSGGALIAFVVALFTEMYGFPLTIYLLTYVFGIPIPLDHVSGHLLGDLITYLGLGNGWLIVMIASNVLMVFGIWLVAAGWERVHQAGDRLVTDAVYAHVRHPQYAGIFAITLGLMVQWPTLPTLLLWPFVILMYIRLARREEAGVLARYPVEYAAYMECTPAYFPRLFGQAHRPAGRAARVGALSSKAGRSFGP
jgi:protein-S-isoprenylcysteine O-methyltransferase Ste14